MQPWFLWKDIDSRDMGIWIKELPQPMRPAERVQEVTILGRPGTLHLTEGENVHEGYKKECQIIVRSDADFYTILTWLSGRGQVVFSNEPDRVYEAYIPNEVKFAKNGNSLKQATIPFFVNPHKGQYPPETSRTVSSGDTIYNPGTVAAKPIINLTFTETASIKIGDEEMDFYMPPTTDTKIKINTYSYAMKTGTAQEKHDAVGDVMDVVFGVGNVDLLSRPEVPCSELTAAGWTDAGDEGTATIYSVEYYAGMGNDMDVVHALSLVFHLTPIMVSGNSYTIKTPQELRSYLSTLAAETTVEAIINRDKPENSGYGLLLWLQEVGHDWEEAKDIGKHYDEWLSTLQGAYYLDEYVDMPIKKQLLELMESTVTEEETPVHVECSISVDCDAQIATDDEGLWEGKISGGFIRIPQGSSEITLTNCTASILPRWRWF